jgi:hypothetical protein
MFHIATSYRYQFRWHGDRETAAHPVAIRCSLLRRADNLQDGSRYILAIPIYPRCDESILAGSWPLKKPEPKAEQLRLLLPDRRNYHLIAVAKIRRFFETTKLLLKKSFIFLTHINFILVGKKVKCVGKEKSLKG